MGEIENKAGMCWADRVGIAWMILVGLFWGLGMMLAHDSPGTTLGGWVVMTLLYGAPVWIIAKALYFVTTGRLK